MRETAPLFGRSPNARVGDPAPARPLLEAGNRQDTSPSADHTPAGRAEPEPDPDIDERAEQRGRRIIERLQAGARAADRPELGPDEMAMVLEAVTNLPEDAIERLTLHATAEARARTDELRGVAAEQARAADPDKTIALAATAATDGHPGSATGQRSAAQLAAESFPHSAADAIRTTSVTGTKNTLQAPIRVHSPDRTKRPGPSI